MNLASWFLLLEELLLLHCTLARGHQPALRVFRRQPLATPSGVYCEVSLAAVIALHSVLCGDPREAFVSVFHIKNSQAFLSNHFVYVLWTP